MVAEWGCGARRRWVAPSSSGGASFRRPALRPVPVKAERPGNRTVGQPPGETRRALSGPGRECPGAATFVLAGGGSSWMGLQENEPRLPTDGPSMERGSPKSPRRAPGRRPQMRTTRSAPAGRPPPLGFPGGERKRPWSAARRDRTEWKDHNSGADASREGETVPAFRRPTAQNSAGTPAASSPSARGTGD